MFIGELGGDKADVILKCAGQLPARACSLPRVVGVELGLWPDRARRWVVLRVKENGSSTVVRAVSALPFLGHLGEGGRCGPRLPRFGSKGLHVGKGSASELFC